MAKKSPVVHFEMPVIDRDRVREFYAKAFGWEMIQLGPEMGNYILAQTTETDENNMVQTPGTINGGFMERNEKNTAPSIVISVEDIHEAMKNVTEAGGTILGGQAGPDSPDEIPGIGLFTSIKDTEGNVVGLLQPVQSNS